MANTTDTTYTIEIKRLSTGDYQLAKVKINDEDKTQDYKETFDKVLKELGLPKTTIGTPDLAPGENKDADQGLVITDINDNSKSNGGRKYSKRNRKVSRKSLKKSSK